MLPVTVSKKSQYKKLNIVKGWIKNPAIFSYLNVGDGKTNTLTDVFH